jgi:glycosyltransferase involved in cell wall biosynthesis
MTSAIILTKNEEKNISRCISSLIWVDQVILIDDLSNDETIKIAKKTNPKIEVYTHPLNSDFGAQHNFGMEKAKGDWLFFVDADEEVPEALRDEIITKIKDNKNTKAYAIKRQDVLLGKKINHGETMNTKFIRLAKKGSGIWKREVHEYWDINKNIETLNQPLLHYPHPTISEFISSINFYTSIDSKYMFDKEEIRFSLFRTIVNPVGKFIQNYIFRLGFLDGLPGLIIAVMMSLHSLIVRIKLYELSK